MIQRRMKFCGTHSMELQQPTSSSEGVERTRRLRDCRHGDYGGRQEARHSCAEGAPGIITMELCRRLGGGEHLNISGIDRKKANASTGPCRCRRSRRAG